MYKPWLGIYDFMRFFNHCWKSASYMQSNTLILYQSVFSVWDCVLYTPNSHRIIQKIRLLLYYCSHLCILMNRYIVIIILTAKNLNGLFILAILFMKESSVDAIRILSVIMPFFLFKAYTSRISLLIAHPKHYCNNKQETSYW